MSAESGPSLLPPPGLPAGWEEIWRAVHEEDRRAKNRGELARRLGVSTHTLQRLLGDGSVPDFRRASVRQRRAWARTVARLARRLGGDPADWVRRVGIPRDAGVEAILTGESGPGPDSGAAGAAAVEPLVLLRRRARQGGVIEIGIVARPLLGEPLPGRNGSLFSELARRAVGCVEPTWNPEFRLASPADPSADPRRGRPAAVVGLFDSALARANGIELLPVPGWRSELEAILAGGPAGGPPPAGPPLRYLVIDGDPGATFLRVHRGIPVTRLVASRRSTPEDLAEELAGLVEENTGGPVALVADGGTCAAVKAHLRGRVGLGGSRRLLPDPIRLRYGLALPATEGPWRRSLTWAWDKELFGLARNEIAALYGDQLLVAALRAEELGSTPANPVSWLAVEPFEAADGEFRRVACRQLLSGLLTAAGKGGAQPSETAWERLVTNAHAVMLAPWRESFDRLAWAAKLELFAGTAPSARPLHRHCRSCSTSLREYPGPAADYCTFCSDERGQLRSRNEVHRMIAEWMRGWQEELDEAESMRRAERYMGALPAWSRN